MKLEKIGNVMEGQDGVCYYGDNPGNMYILTELQ